MSTGNKSPGTGTQIVGSDGITVADVELSNGKNRLITNATVTVEQVLGSDPLPDSWFRINAAGAINDTVRVQIAGTNNDSTSPDRDVAAVDLTYTLIADDVGNEEKLRDNIITYLNSQTSFKNAFLKAQKVEDRAIIHITSTKFSLDGEFYERPNSGDFNVTTTGTTSVTLGYNDFVGRSKATSLARDISNPHRLGILGISGSVTVTPGEVADIYIENAVNGGSSNLLVNGSVTPVVFLLPTTDTKDIFIQELRFYGQGNGIKFGQFLSKPGAGGLTNGVKVEIKSDDSSIILPLYKTTEDFKNKFAFGTAANFRIDIQSGSDGILAVFTFDNPFAVRATGTYVVDDYVKVTIQDNLTSGIAKFEFLAKGFEKDA